MHNIFEVFKSLRGNKAHNIYLVTPETCCQRKILSPVSELRSLYILAEPRLLREVCSPPQVMDQCLLKLLALVFLLVVLLPVFQMASPLRLSLVAGPPRLTSYWTILFACSVARQSHTLTCFNARRTGFLMLSKSSTFEASFLQFIWCV